MPAIQDYDYPPFRPPNEAHSALLRFTRGCPWNKCAFCYMYKGMKFETKPPEEVNSDIRTAREIYGARKNIFIADSDSLTWKGFADAVATVREVFPEAERVTSYARARTLANLGVEKLRTIKNAGLTRVHIGLESGDKETLELMCKGATPEQMIAGGRAAKAAGLEVSLYVIVGAGGKHRWEAHARGTASVINAIGPMFVRLRALTIQHGTPLRDLYERGEFALVPPIDRLREVALLLQELEVEGCEFKSDHMTNYLWSGGRLIYTGVNGQLPEDKRAMLEHLEGTIGFIEAGEFPVVDSNMLHDRGLMTYL